MRILFVTPHPSSRIRVRGYEFLTQLQSEHEVTVMTQCRSEQEHADVEALRQQGLTVGVVQETKREAMLRSGLALFSAQPLQVAYARSARFTQAIRELCRQRTFDVIHVEHLRGIASMEQIADLGPLVWDAVDCISLLFKYAARSGPSLSVRAVASLEQKRTQHYEARIVQRLRHIAVTSEHDRQALTDLHRHHTGDHLSSDEALGARITVLPNGVDLDYFCPLNQEKRRFNIVFSGKMSYHANVATALYLYQQIMPLIWQQQPEATLTIVGSKPPKSLQLLARDPRVEVTGYVSDMRPYIRRAEIMLSPMVYSVGIQNKVLEAMALGVPVVISAQAAGALGARPGRDLLVAGSTQEFADATLHLMNDASLRTSLGQFGRAYVEQHHDWHVLTSKLVEIYRQAIAHYERQYATLHTVSLLQVER
jgi:polysaccharide biosynthesis protein PslH